MFEIVKTNVPWINKQWYTTYTGILFSNKKEWTIYTDKEWTMYTGNHMDALKGTVLSERCQCQFF